jgi:hypothetical protein
VCERVLFIGTQFSILYTSMYSPATGTPPSGFPGNARGHGRLATGESDRILRKLRHARRAQLPFLPSILFFF